MMAHSNGCPILTVVVPCYNEEEVLVETTLRLSTMLRGLVANKQISSLSTVLYVDDGSNDRTWEYISEFNLKYPEISGLKLARNVGHQNALLAGLLHAKETADCVISIDSDLQDDVEVIPEFISKFKEGNDIVYGVRSDRSTDTLFKRKSAIAFYKVLSWFGVNLVFNHADYRLMSKRALNGLERYREVNLFLRGIVPLIGYKSTEVYYERNKRFAGESKYPLKKMISFALDGVTSFSISPIRFITMIGISFFLLSLITAVYVLVSKFNGNAVSGWPSLMISIWFIGGVQLISLGLIGEYIGKIYKEVKGRPKYTEEIKLDALVLKVDQAQ
ncbi:glycosyltransferase family 2 protein [Paenibacillus glacialis]|uniref:Glycosyltransferase n=1 Tax=Paenibacillus glacialis TaxID=494026 RepID=A0A168LGK2_9BACL|nr:glycosyltransferase family 2 protein [Paenibacillus glacialis]OAB43364.1 glycosyltransferase [Paenibacillus glacialis]